MTWVAIVARHAPLLEGTASGRILLGFCQGVQALGLQPRVWYWGPERPSAPLPDWCEWRPLSDEPRWRTHARALAHPRSDIVRAGWRPPDDALAVAEDVPSYPAAAGHPAASVTLHYATMLDCWALRRARPKDLQDARAERAFARTAPVALAYSPRVADLFGGRPRFVPAAFPLVDQVDPIDAPRALLLADWGWRPNVVALGWLLRLWPRVAARVRGAQLLIAGRGTPSIGTGLPGVRQLGEVRSSADALGQAAVLAFPCPATSGPKIKVLESMARGVPVVTTPAGREGLVAPSAAVAVATTGAAFAHELAALLADPERRAAQTAAARAAFLAHHAPVPAARVRLAALGGLAGGRSTSNPAT